MANQQKRIKALIDKNIRDILQFELKNEVGFLTVINWRKWEELKIFNMSIMVMNIY